MVDVIYLNQLVIILGCAEWCASRGRREPLILSLENRFGPDPPFRVVMDWPNDKRVQYQTYSTVSSFLTEIRPSLTSMIWLWQLVTFWIRFDSLCSATV
jgi:hypothetical protein